MSEILDVPAFPNKGNNSFERVGMTLRDYFAAKAMQALIANKTELNDIPSMAYQMADGMLLIRTEDL